MLPPMLNNLSLSTEDEGALKSLLANFANIGSLVEFIFHHSPSILYTKFFLLILFREGEGVGLVGLWLIIGDWA